MEKRLEAGKLCFCFWLIFPLLRVRALCSFFSWRSRSELKTGNNIQKRVGTISLFFWHFSGQDIDDLLPGAEKVEEIDPNFPDLSQHNNWMSKSLTPAIYRQLKDRKTSSGYTLDMCIQTGKRMVISLHVAWRRNACRIRYVSCAACFHSNTSCLSSLRISSFRDYIIFLTLSVLPESPQVVGNVSSSPSTWPF